jgi:hypothetical protein
MLAADAEVTYEDCLELALNHSLAIVLPSIERLQLKTGGPFSPDADTSRGFLGPFVLDTAMTLPISPDIVPTRAPRASDPRVLTQELVIGLFARECRFVNRHRSEPCLSEPVLQCLQSQLYRD